MLNCLSKKGLVLLSISLFIGASLFPAINGYTGEFKRSSSYLSTPLDDILPGEELLDMDLIFSITENLSNIVFTEYDEANGEIARGRAFGTKGEHKAADIIEENMTKLGLWTEKEQIYNTENLPTVASKHEVLDYELVITDISSGISEKVDDCYIAPTWLGPRWNLKQLDYDVTWEDLEIKLEPKLLAKNDYVVIAEDYSYNPNLSKPPIIQFLSRFLSPYSTPILFSNMIKRVISFYFWYFLYPRCQGFVRYDFNDDTHNMANSVYWPLPVIFINGTIGKKIMEDPDNYRLSYRLKQHYVETVESYNVVGQLNGTKYPDKIIVIDSLYDGWWCQATGDSAIGTAMVLGIAKYFYDHQIAPDYTLRFIGFCGEEHGYRGAKHYEDTHRDDDIIYVVDLNQLGFNQDEPDLSLDILVNNLVFMKKVKEIASKTDYANRVENVTGVNFYWMPNGAPSNDKPFACSKFRPSCKTVCFLKGVNWILHHRDGLNHTAGDVIDYYYPADVAATGEIVLNLVTELAVDS